MSHDAPIQGAPAIESSSRDDGVRVYVIGMHPELPPAEAKALIDSVDLCVLVPYAQPLPTGAQIPVPQPFGTLEVVGHEAGGRILICKRVSN